MRSPPQIALEPLPQAHRVVMSIEKLIDHERQHIALVVCESSAGGSGSKSVAALTNMTSVQISAPDMTCQVPP